MENIGIIPKNQGNINVNTRGADIAQNFYLLIVIIDYCFHRKNAVYY